MSTKLSERKTLASVRICCCDGCNNITNEKRRFCNEHQNMPDLGNKQEVIQLNAEASKAMFALRESFQPRYLARHKNETKVSVFRTDTALFICANSGLKFEQFRSYIQGYQYRKQQNPCLNKSSEGKESSECYGEELLHLTPTISIKPLTETFMDWMSWIALSISFHIDNFISKVKSLFSK